MEEAPKNSLEKYLFKEIVEVGNGLILALERRFPDYSKENYNRSEPELAVSFRLVDHSLGIDLIPTPDWEIVKGEAKYLFESYKPHIDHRDIAITFDNNTQTIIISNPVDM